MFFPCQKRKRNSDVLRLYRFEKVQKLRGDKQKLREQIKRQGEQKRVRKRSQSIYKDNLHNQVGT